MGGAGAASVKSGRSDRSLTGTARFGSEYASGKGRGDVKRAGRPDPYAYVPLKRNTLNKRSVVGVRPHVFAAGLHVLWLKLSHMDDIPANI